MKDLVAAISVGRVDDKIVLDLDYAEEAYDEGPVADIPMAVIPSTGEVSLLQMDGEVTKEQLAEGFEMVQKAAMQIRDIQINALKDKYRRGEKNE